MRVSIPLLCLLTLPLAATPSPAADTFVRPLVSAPLASNPSLAADFSAAPASIAAPAAAEPSTQLVIMLARAPSGARVQVPGPRFASRLAALGLTRLSALSDGITVAPGAAPLTNPFDLDPSRVMLVAASDASTAAAAAAALAGDPEVEWVEPNQPRTIAGLAFPDGGGLPPGPFPDDPMFTDGRQWGLRNLGPAGRYGGIAGADIHALEAWQRSVGSNDLRLAIADTGIDPDQPDLQATLPDGSSRIERGLNVTLEPIPVITDSMGHGTLVTGVMAARTNDGVHFDSLGMAGVCGGDGGTNYGCHIVPIKIAPGHSGEATSYDIARAIVYSVAVGARAMNLSFAGSSPSRVERTALYYAITRGCVVVAAAGNRGFLFGTEPQYPAAYARDGLCIQVGASDPSDQRTLFSSYGPGLDLLAPGLNVWTTFMTYPSYGGASYPGYVAASGTSLAAPHVTGAVGLLAAARPDLADDDLQRVLRESTDDVGAPGVDPLTGHGRLNVAAALEAVRPALGLWHDEVAATLFSSIATDTLRVGESGPGTMDRVRTWPRAELIEATATVAIPDSFLDSIRVWPRVGGTFTVRGGFRLPYFAPSAEVIAQDARSFSLRGYLYRSLDSTCGTCSPNDAYLPLPPDQARFGFTVLGRVDRPPTVAVTSPAPGVSLAPGDTLAVAWSATDPDQVTEIEVWFDPERGAPLRLARVPGANSSVVIKAPCLGPRGGHGSLRVVVLDEHGPQLDQASAWIAIEVRGGFCAGIPPVAGTLEAWPNPSRDITRIAGAPGGRLDIVDPSGRVVRRAVLDAASGEWSWDGRDARGRSLPPGVYLLRLEGDRGPIQRKIVRVN